MKKRNRNKDISLNKKISKISRKQKKILKKNGQFELHKKSSDEKAANLMAAFIMYELFGVHPNELK